MENKYFYAVVDKRTDKLILESGNLPIFWLKQVARNVSANFTPSKVKRIKVTELYKILKE